MQHVSSPAAGPTLQQTLVSVLGAPFAMTKSRSGTPRSFRALLFGFVQGPVSSAAQTHPALLPDASSVHPNALRGMTRGL